VRRRRCSRKYEGEGGLHRAGERHAWVVVYVCSLQDVNAELRNPRSIFYRWLVVGFDADGE
jgi:hypothetical protein